MRRPIVVALVAAALALAWQALTVHYNYGGNWTALFCTGGKLQSPPQLASENIYKFGGSDGYDGQFYHYEAHDPFLRRGMTGFIDSPRLRYRRILVPAAAYLLAGGQDRFVDTAFIAVVLLSVFLGAWWISRCAVTGGRHAAWGLGFLAVSATLISIDRLVIDATLCALVAGFAYYARQGPSRKVYLVLACSLLTRETGVVLIGSYCLFLLCDRRFRLTALFATSAVPALAWIAYVHAHLRSAQDLVHSFLAVKHFWPKLSPIAYPLPAAQAAVLVGFDYLSLAGICLAAGLAIRGAVRRPVTPEAVAGLCWAALVLWTWTAFQPSDPYTLPRLVSPLLILVALDGSRAGWTAMALVSGRVVLQFGPQVLGVLRGLF